MPLRPPAFLSPSSATPIRKWRERVWWDVVVIGLVFACVVFLAAYGYRYGTPRGWGIEPTFNVTNATTKVVEPVDYWDCVHFSIVTIATLGYGDYRPVSGARVIAGVEVTVGILLMGFLISRLVSRQQDRLLRRVVQGQLNVEIQKFRDMIADLIKGYRSYIGMKESDPVTKAQRSFLLSRTAGLTKSVARYWRHEQAGNDFFEVAQRKSIGRILGDMVALLRQVMKAVEKETAASIEESDRTHIRNISESILFVARTIQEQGNTSEESSLLEIYSAVESLRDRFKLTCYIREVVGSLQSDAR